MAPMREDGMITPNPLALRAEEMSSKKKVTPTGSIHNIIFLAKVISLLSFHDFDLTLLVI